MLDWRGTERLLNYVVPVRGIHILLRGGVLELMGIKDLLVLLAFVT